MSAPTPKWSDEHTLAVIAGDLATEWPATPADVRLWLLEAGAEERQWCETHADYAMRHLGTSCRWAIKVLANRPRKACRMVSVLVWLIGGEQ